MNTNISREKEAVELVTVLHKGKSEVTSSSKYSGEFAVVRFQGRDKVSLLFASATPKHDNVHYIDAKTKSHVFGEDIVSFSQTYDNAIKALTNPSMWEDFREENDFKMLQDAMFSARHVQRLIDSKRSYVVGRVLKKFNLASKGPFDYLTHRAAVTLNYKRPGLHIVFETSEPIQDLEHKLPLGATIEPFYDEDNEVTNEDGNYVKDENGNNIIDIDKTIFDMSRQFSMSVSEIESLKSNYPNEKDRNFFRSILEEAKRFDA